MQKASLRENWGLLTPRQCPCVVVSSRNVFSPSRRVNFYGEGTSGVSPAAAAAMRSRRARSPLLIQADGRGGQQHRGFPKRCWIRSLLEIGLGYYEK